jgi:hypothetical protein
MRHLRDPEVARKIDAVIVNERNALVDKELPHNVGMPPGPSASKFAIPIHHAVGDIGDVIGTVMQRPANHARTASVTKHRRDRSISGDATGRDLTNDVVDSGGV